jgi:hypothetical protein
MKDVTYAFPSFGNLGAPSMAIFIILGLSLGLLVWLMSTLNVINAHGYSLLVKYIPPPSTSFGEILSPNNQKSKQNKKNEEEEEEEAAKVKGEVTNDYKSCWGHITSYCKSYWG